MVRIRPVGQVDDLACLSGSVDEQGKIPFHTWLNPDNVGLVAVTDTGTPVGAVLLVPDKRVVGRIVSYELVWIFVAEPYRCQGIAHALLRAASRAVERLDCSRIHVSIRPNNAAGLALFDRLGPTSGATYIIWLRNMGL